MRFLPFLISFFLFFNNLLPAQSSTFDTGTENWSTNADGSPPVWMETGGNPGGWLSAYDISTGGTWHWVAPPLFLGNVCGSYGLTLSFDLKTSESQNNTTKPDVILVGDNMNLVYNTAFDPNTFWTNYEVVLKEDAGWKINTVSGPVPTKAQFAAVLSSLGGLQIRGEFLQSAEDQGGLDNVVLKTTTFDFDLDDNDSTTPPNATDFRTDTICYDNIPVADLDAVLVAESAIDSIVIQLVVHPDGLKEYLDFAQPIPPYYPSVTGQHTWRMVLKNNGQTIAALYREAIKDIRYYNDAFPGSGGTRTVNVMVYTGCGALGNANAYIPYFPPAYAGEDGSRDFCPLDPPADIRLDLTGPYESGGYWYPAFTSGDNRFDPETDQPGFYNYVVKSSWAGCPDDTAAVDIRIATPIRDLGNDQTLCRDSVFRISLAVLPEFESWVWSTGSSAPSIVVNAPGLYSIAVTSEINGCIFQDSIRIDYVTCTECPVYVPNAFSPDDDGDNDQFQAFAGCDFLTYHLVVYDRWGALVFETFDPGDEWNGDFKGKNLNPGVFFWLLDYETEYLGQALKRRVKGDISLVK